MPANRNMTIPQTATRWVTDLNLTPIAITRINIPMKIIPATISGKNFLVRRPRSVAIFLNFFLFFIYICFIFFSNMRIDISYRFSIIHFFLIKKTDHRDTKVSFHRYSFTILCQEYHAINPSPRNSMATISPIQKTKCSNSHKWTGCDKSRGSICFFCFFIKISFGNERLYISQRFSIPNISPHIWYLVSDIWYLMSQLFNPLHLFHDFFYTIQFEPKKHLKYQKSQSCHDPEDDSDKAIE